MSVGSRIYFLRTGWTNDQQDVGSLDRARDIAWAPDGDRLAYVRGSEIYTVDSTATTAGN